MILAISLFNACYPTKRLTKTEAQYAFEVLDANQNGAIDYIELQSIFACHILRENEQVLLNEFKRVDVVELALLRTVTVSSTQPK